jgi:hypothetical protein
MISSIPYLRIRNIRTLALYSLPACFRRLLVNPSLEIMSMSLRISAERFASCRKSIHWDEVAHSRPDNDTCNQSGRISLTVILVRKMYHTMYRHTMYCHILLYRILYCNCPYIHYNLGRMYFLFLR